LADPADSDDVDSTNSKEPPGVSGYVLDFDTGESIAVTGLGLVGRAPTPKPDQTVIHLVAIADPTRSVSKTHLEFGLEAGELWVMDRGSTNGSSLLPRGGEMRWIPPGQRAAVQDGDMVCFGHRFFTVKGGGA
jgi:hypothetical protein